MELECREVEGGWIPEEDERLVKRGEMCEKEEGIVVQGRGMEGLGKTIMALGIDKKTCRG